MSQSVILIKPNVDAGKRQYFVEQATIPGLGAIRGKSRRAFEQCLMNCLPPATQAVVSYRRKPVVLQTQ